MLMFFVFYIVLFATFFVFAKKWLQRGPDVALLPPHASHAVGALLQARR